MPAPNTVVVKLKAELKGGKVSIDDNDCRFSPAGSGKKHGNTIQITAGGAADITFDLDDKTGLHLRFPDLAADAIWLQNGPNCPTQPGDAGGEFVVRQLGKKKLTITDSNIQNGEFGYALNFDSSQGRIHHDPIIKNGI